MTLSSIQKDL